MSSSQGTISLSADSAQTPAAASEPLSGPVVTPIQPLLPRRRRRRASFADPAHWRPWPQEAQAPHQAQEAVHQGESPASAAETGELFDLPSWAFAQQVRARRLIAQRPQPAMWVPAFIVFQFACQIALLLPAEGVVRVAMRAVSFGASLALLVFLRGKGKAHPAIGAAIVILGILGLELLHPDCNTLAAGAAQWVMYAAILAPIFWVPRLAIDGRALRRIILTLWACQTISACIGVLQVYRPGQFDPPISPVIEARGKGYVESLKVTLPNGAQCFRPMGLTDQPGAAANAGLYALLFGLGLLLCDPSQLMKPAYLASMAVGLFCIYMSQVRYVLVMSGICVMAFAAVLALRRDFGRLLGMGALVALVVGASFVWAVAIGGDAVTSRLKTLVAQRADEVYYDNRGFFLYDTVTHLMPEYPLGAGLGRWGMMHNYFGSDSDPKSSEIWVEIQWTGWLLDGGVPLIIAYVAAIALAFIAAWRIAMDRRTSPEYAAFYARNIAGRRQRAAAEKSRVRLGVWAALILAYNLSAFAVTFNYPLFIGQYGLEFWLLNACLYTAYRNEMQRSRGAPPASVFRRAWPALPAAQVDPRRDAQKVLA